MPPQETPVIEPKVYEKTKTMPPWNVIILNDEEHSFEYVIELLTQIFNHDQQSAINLTIQIDKEGRAIVDTTSRERAELKQEQVHAKGRDYRMGNRSTGPLKCEIEPAE